MYYEVGDEVRTKQAVSKDAKTILVANGIKPGTKGIIKKEKVYLTIDFNGIELTLLEDEVEIVQEVYSTDSDPTVDYLKNMFDMR